jgi:hypothetical protein
MLSSFQLLPAILLNFLNNSISGDVIVPYFSKELEGFDINNPEDIILLEHFYKKNNNLLEEINLKPFKK